MFVVTITEVGQYNDVSKEKNNLNLKSSEESY